ncbi:MULTISPECIES: TetR/AcrR family transcriptional regulator [Bacillus]|uniref:TetR/AcrR family transcriptional regulator n=1 Tax=Bacillus TaxID=1386 RepID=UPI0004252915|nr:MULTISPECIES: TetR/AcrR family transcriptional regulator [Bacillus]QHZ45656.1 TetR/AcrR family transcriptional regulator [Bacillus sp. NSP9.1]WFA04540.1 TetR/AcrR family transcriptional regulator [Bacillus sp. HSf4]
MREKERVIIETAIKLFAKKGYSSTSVQEIAKECQISKGAFYIYFKSKEALLLSVLHYYYDKIFTRIQKIQTENDNPRDVYRKQLAVFFENILEHKEFITMQFNERSLPINEEIESFAKKMRTTTLKLHMENIRQIYGKDIEPYSAELCFMINGMSDVYLELMILLHHSIDLHLLADHLLNRLDDLAEGIMKRNEMPLISIEEADKWFGPFYTFDPLKEALLKEMRIKADKRYQGAPPSDLTESLGILDKELRKQKPRNAIIKGMLYNIKEYEALQKEAVKLAELLRKKPETNDQRLL